MNTELHGVVRLQTTATGSLKCSDPGCTVYTAYRAAFKQSTNVTLETWAEMGPVGRSWWEAGAKALLKAVNEC